MPSHEDRRRRSHGGNIEWFKKRPTIRPSEWVGIAQVDVVIISFSRRIETRMEIPRDRAHRFDLNAAGQTDAKSRQQFFRRMRPLRVKMKNLPVRMHA